MAIMSRPSNGIEIRFSEKRGISAPLDSEEEEEEEEDDYWDEEDFRPVKVAGNSNSAKYVFIRMRLHFPPY